MSPTQKAIFLLVFLGAGLALAVGLYVLTKHRSPPVPPLVIAVATFCLIWYANYRYFRNRRP
jgi:hypothetical protein